MHSKGLRPNRCAPLFRRHQTSEAIHSGRSKPDFDPLRRWGESGERNVQLPIAQLGAKVRAMRSQALLRWLNIALGAGIAILLVLQFLAAPLKNWAETKELHDSVLLIGWVAMVCSRAIDPRRRMRPVSWAFLTAFALTVAALPLIPLARSRGIVSQDGYAGLTLGVVFANLIFGACVVGFQTNAKLVQPTELQGR